MTLETLYAGNPDEHLEELAYHFSQVHAGPGAEKAVEYCARAGEKARRLSANDGA